MSREKLSGLEDFREILPWLPPGMRSILDIGCGPAWVDVFIGNHFGLDTINLMDGEAYGVKRNGYHPAGEPWWTAEPGAQRAREKTKAHIVVHKPDPGLTIPVDAVISLKSWCHHYPVEHYLPLVQRSLGPGGHLIVDVRSNTRGLEVLNDSGFRTVWTGGRSPKCQRAALVRL